jgi:hypothetical protein
MRTRAGGAVAGVVKCQTGWELGVAGTEARGRGVFLARAVSEHDQGRRNAEHADSRGFSRLRRTSAAGGQN